MIGLRTVAAFVLVWAPGSGCASTAALAAPAAPSCADRKPEFRPTPRLKLTTPARITRKVFDPYPPSVVNNGWRTSVVVLIEVTDRGQPRCVYLADSSGDAQVDAIAVAAPQQFTFTPGKVGTRPVDSIVPYEYVVDRSIGL